MADNTEYVTIPKFVIEHEAAAHQRLSAALQRIGEIIDHAQSQHRSTLSPQELTEVRHIVRTHRIDTQLSLDRRLTEAHERAVAKATQETEQFQSRRGIRL